MAEACAAWGTPRWLGRGWLCGSCFVDALQWLGDRAATRLAELAAIAPTARTEDQSAVLVEMLRRRERRRLYQRDWHRRQRAEAAVPSPRQQSANMLPIQGPGRITRMEVDDVLAKVG